MKTNSTLFWQVLLVFAVTFLGVWIACQWTAAQLDYSVRLGPAWFYLGNTPVYQPWRFFGWWFSYEAYAPEVFDRGGLIAGSSGVAAIMIAVTGSVWRARLAKHVTTYGSARWASRRDVKRAGLLSTGGVFLGQIKKAYLRHDGPEHVMAFAPTRSGKGVGLVVPTLLSWPHSAVIHDIKGENWELTAGWRATFSRTLRFDPTSETTARYNPLLEVRKGVREVSDVQNIADILVDPDGALQTRSHWDKTAHTLLVGTILHVLYAEADKTLSGVAAFLSDPDRSVTDTLDQMLATGHLGSGLVHPIVAQCAREVLNKTEAERSGVVSTALTFLSLYRDPVVAAETAACDFTVEELVRGESPLSLYLVVPPSDISRTRPLIRLILNQIGRRLTEEGEGDTSRRQVLFMLDEFPALGRLAFFEDALGYMAGFGLRAFLITQSLNQIDKAYGPTNAILDHCHVRVAFATNDERTAKRISDALGTTTEQRAMKNYAGHRLAPWLSHIMVSRQETARQLLTPGEVMQLPSDEEIVMLSGMRPVKARKLRYFEDRNFIGRCLPAPDPSGDTTPRQSVWDGLQSDLDDQLVAKRMADNDDAPGALGRTPTFERRGEPGDPAQGPDRENDDKTGRSTPGETGPDDVTKGHGFDRSDDLGMLRGDKGKDRGPGDEI